MWLTRCPENECYDFFIYLILHSENYFMSLTMCLGSFIAGATSEGGGAIAYPVMTLGPWKIAPLIARDFSLMIQSVGMIAAGASIGSFSGIFLTVYFNYSNLI